MLKHVKKVLNKAAGKLCLVTEDPNPLGNTDNRLCSQDQSFTMHLLKHAGTHYTCTQRTV